jgi:cellulose synthase/poly-beta-1,6-N-acetylglucosamine synthase-like glycosyltransferase
MYFFVSLIILLFAAYGMLIEYYRRAWNALPSYVLGKTNAEKATTKISVIIPVRNEQNNIKSLLDCIFEQSYPKNLYQVIVVDDHSTDDTWNLINVLQYPHMDLKCLQLADFTGNLSMSAYKKFAIEIAINNASGDLMVTTDADCRPSPDWLLVIASFYETSNAKFIAAPVKIDSGNSFLSIFQTLDFLTLQGITGASLFKKIHSMCNGANLAYEKKVFYEVGGFQGIDNIPSGDDMLLMHKIYRKYPDQVLFLKNKDAVVSTQPVKSWRGFINQRIRWASKADKYDDKRIFWVLVLVYTVNLLIASLVIAAFWDTTYLVLLLVLLLMKTWIEFPFVKSAATFFRQQKLMAYFPLMQPLHIVYTIVIGWLGKFGSYEWKGRKIN